MMAMSKKMLEQEPSEIEMLLPWHAAGTLNARDARRVEEALARDPELARQYAVIREEYAETISSQREPRCAVRARHAEAVRGDRRGACAQAVGVARLSRPRISEFFAGLSPRTLAWSASLGAIALLLQAGVIGAVLDEEPDRVVPDRVAKHERAVAGPITRDLGGGGAATRAGAVRAGGAHLRYHGAARQLSGVDRRRRQGRHVSRCNSATARWARTKLRRC